MRVIFKAGIALALAAGLAVVSADADAAVTITATPGASGVQFTGTGSIDLTDLGTPAGGLIVNPSITPNAGNLNLGAGAATDRYSFSGLFQTGLPPFGPGNSTSIGNSTSSGGPFGITAPVTGSFGGSLNLPSGYQSNTALNFATLFENETLTSLGLTPGTYTALLGNNDTVSLTVTPIPAALPLLLSGLAGLAWLRRRQTATA